MFENPLFDSPQFDDFMTPRRRKPAYGFEDPLFDAPPTDDFMTPKPASGSNFATDDPMRIFPLVGRAEPLDTGMGYANLPDPASPQAMAQATAGVPMPRDAQSSMGGVPGMGGNPGQSPSSRGGGGFEPNQLMMMGLGILSNPGQNALTGISRGVLQGLSLYEQMKERAATRARQARQDEEESQSRALRNEVTGLQLEDARTRQRNRGYITEKMQRGEQLGLDELQQIVGYENPAAIYEQRVAQDQAQAEAERVAQMRDAAVAQLPAALEGSGPMTPEQRYGMIGASNATTRKDLDAALSKVFTAPKKSGYDIREGGAPGDPSSRMLYAIPKNDPFGAKPINAVAPSKAKAMIEINDPYGLEKKEQIARREQISKLQGARQVAQDLLGQIQQSRTVTGIPGAARELVGGLAGQISDVTGDPASKALRDQLAPEQVTNFKSTGTQLAARAKEFFAGESGKLSKEDQAMVERSIAVLNKTTDSKIAEEQVKNVLYAFDRAEKRHAQELEQGIKSPYAKSPSDRPAPLETFSRQEVMEDLPVLRAQPGYENATFEQIVDMLREKGYEVAD